jgi:hypothetical protein
VKPGILSSVMSNIQRGYVHDVHNDCPLAPECMSVTEEMLSPFCKSFNKKHIDCKKKKWIPSLRNKNKYDTHYGTLKLYVSLGLKVTKIHRCLVLSGGLAKTVHRLQHSETSTGKNSLRTVHM